MTEELLQFHRCYKLAFNGVLVSSNGTSDSIRINFQVQKTDDESPDTAKISLWNLSPASIAALNEQDCVVTLCAGHKDFMPLVFKGVVTYIETTDDTADCQTYFEATDCRVELRDTYVTLSYEGSINTKQIICDICSEMGLATNFAPNASFTTLPKGFSFSGLARSALDKACASTALRWKAQNNILHIRTNRDVISRDVYLLSPESGLLGIPKKLTYGGDSEGYQQQTGWQVEYFLNGDISVNDFIKLQSKKVSGFFRVKNINMTGDNLQGDWICTAELLALS